MSAEKIDFIGIGAPKSGTTWVSQCLSEHPQVFFSKTKELDFWNKEKIFYKKHEPWKYQEKGLDWYLSNFKEKKENQICGEFSVYYLYDAEAPKLIKKNFPDVKLIAVLRNPVDRLCSHYNHTKYNLYTKHSIKWPSLEKTIEQHPEFLEYGYYSKYIKNYQKYFDDSQLLVIFYYQIKENPEAVMKNIFNFLDIDADFVPPSLKINTNPTGAKTNPIRAKYKNLRFRYSDSILKKIIIKLGIYTFIYKNVVKKIDNFFTNLSYNKKKPKINPEVKQQLSEIFEPYNKELEKILNKNIKWNK